MKKKLLILGAGRGQIGLYKAAKDLQIQTVAGTLKDDNLPCLKYCDHISYMDISDPDEVVEKAKEININGIATSCLDTGVTSLGRVCDTLNFVGLNERAAILCQDKLKMKQIFMENNINTAKFKKISSVENLTESLNQLTLPVIIKATDLQGSRGIYIAYTIDEAIKGFEKAILETKRDYCIVEEFIEGTEFGAQAFIYKGEVLFVMLHGDDTFMSHTAIPVGHYVPYEVSDPIKNQAEQIVKDSIKALGLNNCAVNVDLIIKDNQVFIIELTGRVGANGLPELVSINYGIDYYKMIVLMAINDNPLKEWEKRKNHEKAGYAKMLFSEKDIKAIKKVSYNNIDNNAFDFSIFVKEGDEIRRFTNSNDCYGQIIVEGNSKKDCLEKILQLESTIEIN